MSGLDLKDAFLVWPRAQHCCDLFALHEYSDDKVCAS
jgi:hypothetical protein